MFYLIVLIIFVLLNLSNNSCESVKRYLKAETIKNTNHKTINTTTIKLYFEKLKSLKSIYGLTT